MVPKSKNLCLAVVALILLNSCNKDYKSNLANTGQSSAAIASDKPNILIILADDIGYEIPTVNGGQSYSTPNIDQLAKDGIRFTQCRSAPLCAPSRFMLLTGKYNFRNYSVWGQMDQSQKTIGNMLKDAGFATCYAGKWQLDGGDQSIRTFGFDKYSVWLPYKVCPEEAEGPRYKSAKIFQDGGYLPESQTNNKYSEDVVNDYLLQFIEDNKDGPFIAYYSMIVCHKPFSPTPDDPEYATWNPDPNNNNKKFFPNMVKYMDKKVGLVLNKLNSLGIANNTIVIYVGDNGTPNAITSTFQNKKISGAKGSPREYGIHVPLYCRWPGKIPANKVNGDLINFTDFLPTLADIAGLNVPAYGILDGKSFYSRMVSTTGTPRTWQYCYFKPNNCASDTLANFAQDSIYKLYSTGKFYKFSTDLNETKPLSDASLTTRQKQTKQNLQNVINSMK